MRIDDRLRFAGGPPLSPHLLLPRVQSKVRARQKRSTIRPEKKETLVHLEIIS
jgi:hypothetical protein